MVVLARQYHFYLSLLLATCTNKASSNSILKHRKMTLSCIIFKSKLFIPVLVFTP